VRLPAAAVTSPAAIQRGRATQETEKQHGPGQVELLFDGERPRVAKHAQFPPVDDQPVGAVAHTASRYPPTIGQTAGWAHREGMPPQTRRNTTSAGREPPGAPGVEPLDRDGSRARVLLAKQRRDQKAAQREEHVDAIRETLDALDTT
jgi:hypothetical protein